MTSPHRPLPLSRAPLHDARGGRGVDTPLRYRTVYFKVGGLKHCTLGGLCVFARLHSVNTHSVYTVCVCAITQTLDCMLSLFEIESLRKHVRKTPRLPPRRDTRDPRLPTFRTIYIFTRRGGVPTHGTHTSGTAYTRGTYSRAHTQTRTNKHSPRYMYFSTFFKGSVSRLSNGMRPPSPKRTPRT